MDGVLVVDKPAGPTSHDVVVRVRRALGVRRIGHVGTLDPMATGVLPLVVGRATRLAAYLTAGVKRYDARLQLGVSTDTCDITGTVVADARDRTGAGPVTPPGRAAVEQAAAAFVGTFRQRPPAFSAKKIRGVRAYRLARQQRPVAPEPVEVTVHALDIVSVSATHVHCRVTCDAGFYMRALARDLGAALGCGACLAELRRERSGAFDLDAAIPLAEIDEAGAAAADRMTPLAALLPELPRLVLTEHGARRARHGNTLTAADVLSADRDWTAGGPAGPAAATLHDQAGALIAVATIDAARLLHPTTVLV